MPFAWRILLQTLLVFAAAGPFEQVVNRCVALFAAGWMLSVHAGRRQDLIAASLLGILAAWRVGGVAPELVAAGGPSSAAIEVVEALDSGRAVTWVVREGERPHRWVLSGPGDGLRSCRRGYAQVVATDVVSRRNPDDRDRRRRLLSRGVRGRGYVVGQELAVRDSAKAHVSLRERIAARWRKDLGGQSAFWSALLLGDRSELGRGPQQLFSRLGLAHLLALSGLHVGIVAALLLWPLRRWGRRALFWLLPLIAAWAILAGMSSSLYRSVAMVAWWAVGHRLGRSARVLDGVAAVALLEILWRPVVLLKVGWWLSYVATAAILRSAGWVQRLPRAWAALGVSVVAQVSTLPWILGGFGQVALLSAPLLLVVGPLFAVVLGLGLVFLLLHDAVSWPGSQLALAALSHLLGAALSLASRWMPSPWGHPGIEGGAWAVALTCLGLLLPPWRSSWRGRALLVVALVLLVHLPLLRPPAAEWVSLDVGQGDAGVLRQGGSTLVVDAGPWSPRYDSGRAVVLPYLARRNLDDVDLLITHGHLDHYGGARALLESSRVGRLLVAASDSSETWLAGLSDLAAQCGTTVLFIEAGDSLSFAPPWPIRCLWPPAAGRIDETNSRSLVLRIGPANSGLLTTGDLERDVEARVLRDPWLERGTVAVLKVAHHGGNTGTDETWLERLRPEWALISCARINRYGHPHPEVLRRLRGMGAETLRTDLEGAIEVEWSREGSIRVHATR